VTNAGSTSCQWLGGNLGGMSVGLTGGRVTSIALQLVNGQQYVPSRQLALIRLGKIHLGSPMSLLTSTYAFPVLNQRGPGVYSIFSANQKIETQFGFILDGKTDPLWSVTMIRYK